MERLTQKERNSNGTAISKKSMIDREGYPMLSDYASKVLTKLAAYEDAEEQGLLLWLPCKVGTQIYAIIYDFEQEKYMITETKIIEVTENCNGWFFKLLRNIPAFKLADFGVRVFLNREEAEAKLSEMEGAE